MARKPRAQPIPPWHSTGAAHEAAIAAAGDRYVADLDGTPAHWVIRDRQTGSVVQHCHEAHKSEVEARAALLSRGEPTRADNIAWGKQTRPGRSAKDAASSTYLTPTQWIERLVNDPTGDAWAALQAYVTERRSLTLTALRELLGKVGPEGAITEKALEAISKQLERKFGVRRADGDRR
jgi:hypothetical protein